MHTLIDSIPLPTAQEMRRWDNMAVKLGIPECILMENAAREALYVLQSLASPLVGKRMLLFMGSGNNGGDAAALARHALDTGALPFVLHTKPLRSYKGVTGQHVRMAKKCGVPFAYIGRARWQKNIPAQWQQADIIVDGLLGTGFEGELRTPYIEYIDYINEKRSHAFIYALDIPSGCHALSGKPCPKAVKAHATTCFAAAKPGLVQPHAAIYTGKLFVRSIGIPKKVQEHIPPSYNMLQGAAFAEFLQSTPSNSHKNSFGHVLVLGGSHGLTGAAHLAARAALHSGAGLVSVGAPQGLWAEIKGQNPDIMAVLLGDGYAWPSSLPQNLEEKLAQVHSLALGPGMGTDEKSQIFLHIVLSFMQRPRTVLDADALTLLAKNPDLLAYVREDDVCTPHPGEAARLLGLSSQEVQNDRLATLKKLTQLAPCTWLLKGAGTLIGTAHSPVYILPKDLPTLAVAGSGDVLTGCIAAWLARMSEVPSIKLTSLAACVHGEAGILLKKSFPCRGHAASDIAQALPSAMERLQNLAQNVKRCACESLL